MLGTRAAATDWAQVRTAVTGYPTWMVARACRDVLAQAAPGAGRLTQAVANLLALWLLDPEEADSAGWVRLSAVDVRRIPSMVARWVM